MSSALQGSDCIMKVFVGGDYYPLVCAKSFTLTTTAESIETTTIGDGQWKNFDYNSLSYTIGFDGIMKFVDPLTENGVFEILTAQISFIKLGFKLYYTDPQGTIKILTGTVMITQSVIVAAASQNVTGTIDFQGCRSFAIDAPDADCDIVITGDGLTIVVAGVTYNIHPTTTGSTVARLDWALDGGGFNTVFADNFDVNMGYGAHHLTIIPYCASGRPGRQFDEDFILSSPP